ncbi:ABC transporter ATP-binding protein [Pseudothermotoga sp.]|nr:ABC transporter ATP-binding protein [Pseudothermotoga sp.]MCX7813780.1 ABC transporter ATP-binding protein [Pseudothermotoga sp.]MDW8140598.1 ABC transporter ATP-binding protein [Pseudothermotoga sp.]
MDEREQIGWRAADRKSIHERIFALRVRDLRVSYEELLVLDGLDLELERGELLAVLGPSGCGKTTLLRAILNLVPFSGKIEIGTSKLGYMPQRDTLFEWLNCIDNVALPLLLKGIDKEMARKTAMEHLRKVQLDDWAYNWIYELSGGMRQRVSLARALVTGAELLLMDEPFSSVDAQTRRSLQLLFSHLVAKEGISVLLVTHSVEEAVFLADKILLLTERPAKIRSTFYVPLPKPRGIETLSHQIYQKLVSEIYREIFSTV